MLENSSDVNLESKQRSRFAKMEKNNLRNSSLDSLESDKNSLKRAKILERLSKKKLSIFSNSALSQIDSKTGNPNVVVPTQKGNSALN